MRPVFLDTSALVALADRRDRQHGRAAKALKALRKSHRPLVTSTYVADETITVVRMKLGHREAVLVGEGLQRSEWCRLADVGEEIRIAAWELFVRYSDQRFSFTDCTSFALMRTMAIAEAFTFDRRDFEAAGFSPYP